MAGTTFKLDHLGIEKTNARHAILTGDPNRVQAIVEILGGGHFLSDQRGFVCWQTESKSRPIIVVGSGIGGPATAIVVEELIELGIEAIVRVGTCGIIQKHLTPWSLIVATGCVRNEGTSRQYVDIEFPAVPDFMLTGLIHQALESANCPVEAGIVHSKDAYYLERADKQLIPETTAAYWKCLRQAGVLASEMEASTLFVLGTIRRIRTAAILITVDAIHDKVAFDQSLKIAVGAAGRALETITTRSDFCDSPSKPRHSYLESEL